MSNVWIVFAFKRRFCRRCKKQKKKTDSLLSILYTLQYIYCVLFLRVYRFGHNVMTASPSGARAGGEGGMIVEQAPGEVEKKNSASVKQKG